MCRDTKPFCSQLLMSCCFWNLSRHNFPCRDKHFPFLPINSIATYFSLSRHDFFESLVIFDTKPFCSQLLMSCCFWNLSRHNFPCRDKHFPFLPINSIATYFSLSRHDFFESLVIYVAIKKSLIATDFSSLILFAC